MLEVETCIKCNHPFWKTNRNQKRCKECQHLVNVERRREWGHEHSRLIHIANVSKAYSEC